MRNKIKRKGKKKYSFIVDGKTEKWYLQLMKEHENLKNIDIEPALPKKKKLSELEELIIENAKHYDKVIWIVDFDTIIKEEKERKKSGKSKIQKFKKILHKFKNIENIKILVNTPCLEYWYLLHFKNTSKYYSKCESIFKEFKGTILDNYKKTENYYKKTNNDIYQKLKPLKTQAILRSKKLGNFNLKNYESAKAEIYKIFNILELN